MMPFPLPVSTLEELWWGAVKKVWIFTDGGVGNIGERSWQSFECQSFSAYGVLRLCLLLADVLEWKYRSTRSYCGQINIK